MRFSLKSIKKGLHKSATLWSVIVTEPPAVFISYILANFFYFVHPIHVTLFNLLIITPVLYWLYLNMNWTNLLLSGIFFEITHILDNVDGILARSTKRKTKIGGILDSLSDRMANFGIILLPLGAYRWFGDNLFLLLFMLVFYFRIAFVVLDRTIMKFYSENSRIKRASIREAHKIFSLIARFIPFYNNYKKINNRYVYFNFMDIKMLVISLFPIIIAVFRIRLMLEIYVVCISLFMLVIDLVRFIRILRYYF